MSSNNMAEEAAGNAKPIGSVEYDSFIYRDLETDDLFWLSTDAKENANIGSLRKIDNEKCLQLKSQSVFTIESGKKVFVKV